MAEQGFTKISDFINKLVVIEARTEQDHHQLELLEKKLEVLQAISEKIIGINLKIESLSHFTTRLEQRDRELEDSLERIDRRVVENASAIANNMNEIKALYQQIDVTYGDIQAKLDDLNKTIKADYLSNASFIRLQRNILWALVSGVGAIVVNILLNYFGSQ